MPCKIVDNRRLPDFGGGLAFSGISTADQRVAGIERLPKSTLRAHIAERLRTAILAGDIAPGSALVETALSKRFEVSRGPLREALRQLIEEGLLVTVPYTGTHVASLSVADVREIYSLRTALEVFAFDQVWDRRDERFRAELGRRNEALIATIDSGDDRASISTELALHGLVYEASGHKLLQRAWHGLRGRLQLYWAAHHRAHGRRGPRRDSHDSYIEAALGDDLEAMRLEIADHMRRGAEQTEKFLRAMPGLSEPSSPGVVKGET
jgi:DNA-binding GntR family transcriptional regulator